MAVGPFLVSQYVNWPLYCPPTRMFESLGLYKRENKFDDGLSACSGKLGLLTSQM